MKRIKLNISKSGAIKIIDVEGAGEGCRTLTEVLEKRLGSAQEGTREDTESLYEQRQESGQSISMG